jgi:hypothetical protein
VKLETDENGNLDVHLDCGLVWRPYHYWGDDTDQIDARLTGPDGTDIPGGLDMWPCGTLRAENPDGREQLCQQAETVWADGGVLAETDREQFGAVALIVPGETLTTDSVLEALCRFTP